MNRPQHYPLFKMGLIETLCFALTTDDDWWVVRNDMLFHIRGTVLKECKDFREFLWNS